MDVFQCEFWTCPECQARFLLQCQWQRCRCDGCMVGRPCWGVSKKVALRRTAYCPDHRAERDRVATVMNTIDESSKEEDKENQSPATSSPKCTAGGNASTAAAD